jgi:hypothetical protein
MGESTKTICAAVFMVGAVVAAFAWFEDRPTLTTWCFRIGGSVVAVSAIATILGLHFRTDIERDYLRELAGTYFNRDGFCFAVSATSSGGIGVLEIYFQNQRDAESIGRVAIRPARGFWMMRPNLDVLLCEMQCPPAAFGVARLALSIPKNRQGKRQAFEVAAAVLYPNGRGRRIRFHDGIFLRARSRLGKAFGGALAVAGLAAGSVALFRPVTVSIVLPADVLEQLPVDSEPEISVRWQQGDPPLAPTPTV